jgi:hypothetical protein
MKKLQELSIVFVMIIHFCNAQQPKNNVYGEFSGAGNLYSINYERLFKVNQSVRLGFGVFPENWYEGGLNEKTILNIPLCYQYLIGKTNHKIEASAGLVASFTLSKTQPLQTLFAPHIATGYRYQRAKKGPFIGTKIYLFMPWFLSIDKDDWLLYTGKSYYLSPGLSLGWSF